jgi:hypothetical protein
LLSTVPVSVLLIADSPPPVVSPLLTVELESTVDELSVVVETWDLTAAGGVAAPVVGTVNVGAPAVLSDPGPLLPQAAIASAPAKAASVASDARKPRLLMSCGNLPPGGSAERLRSSWIHPLPAPGAVEQILLRELIAVVAEPQVLDRPGQL